MENLYIEFNKSLVKNSFINFLADYKDELKNIINLFCRFSILLTYKKINVENVLPLILNEKNLNKKIEDNIFEELKLLYYKLTNFKIINVYKITDNVEPKKNMFIIIYKNDKVYIKKYTKKEHYIIKTSANIATIFVVDSQKSLKLKGIFKNDDDIITSNTIYINNNNDVSLDKIYNKCFCIFIHENSFDLNFFNNNNSILFKSIVYNLLFSKIITIPILEYLKDVYKDEYWHDLILLKLKRKSDEEEEYSEEDDINF